MSFNTALSGIRAANTDLSVTGNNIANAGTIGFKSSRAEFGDVYASSLLGGGSSTPGSGVTTLALRQAFSQGNLKFTQNTMDLSINGEGFFVMNDNSGKVYTRAGAFGLDKDGNIVNSSGAFLQGFAADETGNIGGILSNLTVDVSTKAPRATTEVQSAFNLNAKEKVLQSVGQSLVTSGSAIALAKQGLKAATITTTDVGTVGATAGTLAAPINFATSPTTFDITLANSSPTPGGTVSVTLNSSIVTKLQEVADLINSALFSATPQINLEAIVNGSNLEFRDATEGVGSTISISSVTGTNALSTSLNGGVTPPGVGIPPASVAGIPKVTNGYAAQALSILGPTGATVNFTSIAGDSAAKTASKLNDLAGVSATATTTATISAATFNNANANLMLNDVKLTATTLSGLQAQINALTTTTLPGVSATINSSGDLQIVSQVGSDLNFSFAGPVTTDNMDITGKAGTAAQTVNGVNTAAVVGGELKIVLQEGYSITSSVPAVGNIMAPLNAASYTPVLINSFDPAVAKTYNHATSSIVYDSLGNAHNMRTYFVKQNYDINDSTTSPNHWQMHVQIDGKNIGDPDPSLPSPDNTLPTMATYNLYFTSDGTLDTARTGTILVSNWTPLGTDGQPLGTLQPLNVLQGGTTPVAEPPTSSNFQIDLSGSTQFGAVFSVEDGGGQNGYATGRLAGLDVDEKGIVFARFTNGEAQVLGQVALANFNNVEGLRPVGNTMWAETYEAGEPNIGAPQSASLGSITSSALEESNVDLSEELVNLIIAQRNYQANAKTIETANATTQTIINLR
ncbi:MAG TPA: flagellar hook-basal body complex protein [Cellvibrio sp.]|nr:flagellar hook-basal body complex protein [Cellvibrio sp.]